jgi:hypothetical protein
MAVASGSTSIELEDATHRVEAYQRFRDRKFDRQKLNCELSELNRNGGAQ